MTETGEQPNVECATPFLGVVSLAESLRFYVDGLGFDIADQWVHDGALRWCLLRLGGASLMLQEFWRDNSHEGRPEGTLGLGVSICFICRDALAVFCDAGNRGLIAESPFVGNQMWVVRFVDPDGYSIIFESATDVSEGTTLAGAGPAVSP